MNEGKFVRGKPIPEFKKKIVEDFKENIIKSRTVLVASCKGLPGQQFHEIKKKLRGKAEIRFARKSAIQRAIDGIDKGALKNLKENLIADFAIIFSDIDPFELSALLIENESPAFAKSGDIAPEDLEIETGPTDLPAGPAISELQSVGLKVKVTEGKLEIIKGSKVVSKGEKIKPEVASVLAKLDVKPIKVGFVPIAAYDSLEDKVYTNIVIDKAGILIELKNLIGKALGFAVNVGYPTKETISYFIARAVSEGKALARFDNEIVKEEKIEDLKGEIKEELKEELKDNIPDSSETKTENEKVDAAEKIADKVVDELIDDNKNTKEDKE